MTLRRVPVLIALAFSLFGIHGTAQADSVCARVHLASNSIEVEKICVRLP